MADGLDLNDIQGDILEGFKKDWATFLFFKLPDDPARAKTWLGQVKDEVAKTAEVKKFNDEFRAASAEVKATMKAHWMSLAFTYRGLEALGVAGSDLAQLPTAFRQGMAARADVIGDTGKSSPGKWPTAIGSPAVHAMMIIAADKVEDRNHDVYAFKTSAAENGVACIHEQPARTREDARGYEHFGFKDGISQPNVRGFDKPGQPIVEPGEFVLGSPRDPAHRKRNGPPSPGWLNNGSYAVFRRLTQDVRGFEAFVAATKARTGWSADLVRAKLVGRYRSGAPLALANDAPEDPNDDTVSQPFSYAQDPAGVVVPRSAHIRKTFPRDHQPPVAGVAKRRIIRRGIPFGTSFDPLAREDTVYGGNAYPNDRGLCFVCYQRSIADQFEYIQRRWVNARAYPVRGDGLDPVASQLHRDRWMSLGPNVPRLDLTATWVTTTGGDYFFVPSISALGQFAS